MGIVKVCYMNKDAEGTVSIEMREVKSVLVDTRERTLSALQEGEEEVYINLSNVQSITAKGVEITYA